MNSELLFFCFIVIDIFLNTTQARITDITLVITLVWTSSRANPIQICDVICKCLLTIVRSNEVKNYMFIRFILV